MSPLILSKFLIQRDNFCAMARLPSAIPGSYLLLKGIALGKKKKKHAIFSGVLPKVLVVSSWPGLHRITGTISHWPDMESFDPRND